MIHDSVLLQVEVENGGRAPLSVLRVAVRRDAPETAHPHLSAHRVRALFTGEYTHTHTHSLSFSLLDSPLGSLSLSLSHRHTAPHTGCEPADVSAHYVNLSFSDSFQGSLPVCPLLLSVSVCVSVQRTHPPLDFGPRQQSYA